MAFVYQNTYISGDINSIGEVGKNYLTLMQYFLLSYAAIDKKYVYVWARQGRQDINKTGLTTLLFL